MTKVKCNHCREEVHVVLFFYDERILTHQSGYGKHSEAYYEALACGKAICPLCGSELRETYKKTISKEDIIALAGGRGE